VPVRRKVLVLSRNYPNNIFPILGLWVERQVRHAIRYCEPKVIAPVQYAPPLPGLGEYYARYRRIQDHEWMNGVEVFRPRYVIGPGYTTHNYEWMTYYWGVRKQVARLRKSFPFELIHAHYTYPDGLVATQLGKQYGVPVIITEQNLWRPWLDQYPTVRRHAMRAAQASAFHVAISNAVYDSITHFTGPSDKLRVIPDGVDGSAFVPSSNGRQRATDQILFVGIVRPVKGLDILLQAMELLVKSRPQLKLLIVGESFFQTYRREYLRLQSLVERSGIQRHIEFAGRKTDAELVDLMQHSTMLVMPSRLESLGMVLIEALACGTPVVATRCGGPEDIVNDAVGVLVPTENPEALARGIETVLARRADYDPGQLRAYALEKFGLDSVGSRLEALYSEAIERHRAPAG